MIWVLAGLVAIGVVALQWQKISGAILPSAPSAPVPSAVPPLPGGHNEWDDIITQAALAAGLPADAGPLVIKAIIEIESAHTWNPEVLGDRTSTLCPSVYVTHPMGVTGGRTVSTAGYCALGLMQIHRYWNPDEAAQYDLLDGAQNIAAGAQIVARLWALYGDWNKVLAAYNGGPAAGDAYPNVQANISAYVATVGGMFRRYAAAAGVSVA